jgi:hypothetical protein
MANNKNDLAKKVAKLGGLSKEVYENIKTYSSVEEVLKHTGRRADSVGKVITKLIKLGYIKRIEKGYYKVVQKSGMVNPIGQKNLVKPYSDDVDISKVDYLRLHDFQIKLRIIGSDHKIIRSMVLKRKMFKNIRPAGDNDMYHFNVDDNIGLFQIGRQNIHLTFPDGFEILGNDIPDLAGKMYDVVEEQVRYLENILKMSFFKDGRINFEITKNHIALVKNGVVKEMKLSGINHLCIYDDEDGKQRFVMDWSKGLPELEAVHTVHGFDDADRAKYFMNTLKDSSYEKMHKDSSSFFGNGELNVNKLLESDINAQTSISNVAK